jgi:hypothetical protein
MDVELAGELAIFIGNFLEARLVVVDQIHFVDADHDVRNRQQAGDDAVAAALGQHAMAGIDEDDGQVGIGCAGDHVAGVLLVAGGIRDDELAACGGEVAVGNIDRDALLAFGPQAIGEQRQIDAFSSPRSLLECSSCSIWSWKICLLSNSMRPIRVLLPSSTLPAVVKRSRSRSLTMVCSCMVVRLHRAP